MESEIKSIMSTDIFDLENYKPIDDENFCFLVTLTVGIKGEEGGDLFNIKVCTPKWILANYNPREILLGKGKLIVLQCDMTAILSRIKGLFGGRSGKDWNEISTKLSRIGHWEFEDYRP